MDILIVNTNHFQEELQALGHRVLCAAPPVLHYLNRFNLFCRPYRYDFAFDLGESVGTLLERLPRGFKADVVLYYDDSSPALYLSEIDECPVPIVFYSIDAHIHPTWHPVYGGAFDKVLVAMKDYVPEFERFNRDVQWFPLWAPVTIEPAETKDIDVCFRGNMDPSTRSRRAAFFERLSKLVEIDAAAGDYRVAYPRAKILVNEVLDADVNCKVFESMMCGGMLLNPATGNGLLDLFQDGVHLVTYEDNNAEDAAEKIRYYLEHDDERERIAAAGREEILRHHSAAVRTLELEGILKTVRRTNREYCHYSGAFHHLVLSQIKKFGLETEIERRGNRFIEYVSQWRREDLSRDDYFPFMILECKKLLESTGREEIAGGLLAKLIETYPDSRPLRFMQLDNLLKRGLDEDAVALVREVTNDPEHLLGTVPDFMDRLEDASMMTSRNFSKCMGRGRRNDTDPR